MPTIGRLNPEILDVELLQTWRAMSRPGEGDFLKDLVEIFLQRAPELMQAMNEGVIRRDSVAVTQAAHALKGSSSSMGALVMTQVCEVIEFQAPTVVSQGLSHPKVQELLDSFNQVKNELQALDAA